MKKLLVGFLLASLAGLYGCTGDTNTNTAGSSPSASTLQPTGKIQGVLTDTVTGLPVSGAVVDIAGAQATTSPTGQFEINNVPATTDASGAGALFGAYQATIDLRQVNAKITSGAKYPDFQVAPLNVQYTTLNDATPGTASNHATPVTGIATGVNLVAGRLLSSIDGTVATGPATGYKNVGAGYTVELRNAGFGVPGNMIIASATTDAAGHFAMANLPTGIAYYLVAYNSDQSVSNLPAGKILTTVQGTNFLNVANGLVPVVVAPAITQGPVIATVSPANNSVIPAGGSQDIVFTFNKAIKQTDYAQSYNSTTAGSLLNDVAVTFTAKAPAAFALAWSADFTQLIVTVPNVGVSSIYTVDISAVVPKLLDASNNAAAAFGKDVVTLVTNGGQTTAKPAVVATNKASIDYVGTVNFDWTPVNNAKGYNVYRQKAQVFGSYSGAGKNVYPVEFIKTTVNTFADDSVDFVDNNTKLTYTYTVKAYNSDKVEGPASDAITVSDVVAPKLLANAYAAQLAANGGAIVLFFNEPLDKATAQNKANYTLSNVGGVTVTNAVYTDFNGINSSVTLTLSAAITNADIQRDYITTGANGVAASFAFGDDVQALAVGNGGNVNQICVAAPAAPAVITSAILGDDVLSADNRTILAGPDGVCQSAANAVDSQILAVGKGTSDLTAINAGPNLVLETAGTAANPAFTNVYVGLKVSGVKDVAGNLIDATANGFFTNGTIAAAP